LVKSADSIFIAVHVMTHVRNFAFVAHVLVAADALVFIVLENWVFLVRFLF
jgi:hypothetical protein